MEEGLFKLIPLLFLSRLGVRNAPFAILPVGRWQRRLHPLTILERYPVGGEGSGHLRTAMVKCPPRHVCSHPRTPPPRSQLQGTALGLLVSSAAQITYGRILPSTPAQQPHWLQGLNMTHDLLASPSPAETQVPAHSLPLVTHCWARWGGVAAVSEEQGWRAAVGPVKYWRG